LRDSAPLLWRVDLPHGFRKEAQEVRSSKGRLCSLENALQEDRYSRRGSGLDLLCLRHLLRGRPRQTQEISKICPTDPSCGSLGISVLNVCKEAAPDPPGNGSPSSASHRDSSLPPTGEQGGIISQFQLEVSAGSCSSGSCCISSLTAPCDVGPQTGEGVPGPRLLEFIQAKCD